MQYLMIQNDGVAQAEAFTMLGASTARGNSEKIGQFGSGAKHGILTLLRQGLDPIFYLGTHKLSFYTEPFMMEGQEFQRVCYKIGNKQEKLSFTLEFGGLDWQNVHMGLREFISNAIDAGGHTVKLVNTASPHAGKTSVYIPATPEVLNYYRNLPSYFLHFAGKEKQQVIAKAEPSKCKVYRKGVFVRELRKMSMFDYNFNAAVEIDESRNMDEYNASHYAKQYFAEEPQRVLDFVLSNKNNELLESSPYSNYPDRQKKEFLDCWIKNMGNSVIATNAQGPMIQFAEKKGVKVKLLPEGWYSFFKHVGVENVVNLNTGDCVVDNGMQVLPPVPQTVDACKKIWKTLEFFQLTKNKPMPEVRSMSQIMNAGTAINGMHKAGVVYINTENAVSAKVITEEFGHYITGAGDGTRDFQDWAFTVAGRVMEYVG